MSGPNLEIPDPDCQNSRLIEMRKLYNFEEHFVKCEYFFKKKAQIEVSSNVCLMIKWINYSLLIAKTLLIYYTVNFNVYLRSPHSFA